MYCRLNERPMIFVYLGMGQENRLTSISWSPTISSINSARGLSALLGTRAAKMAGSSPVYQKSNAVTPVWKWT